MFKVKIGEDEYEVKFYHSIPPKEAYKECEPDLFRKLFGTVCYLYENGNLVTNGHTDLNINDNFNRNIGRKLSLARVLRYIEPDNRVLFWQAYYQARGNKW